MPSKDRKFFFRVQTRNLWCDPKSLNSNLKFSAIEWKIWWLKISIFSFFDLQTISINIISVENWRVKCCHLLWGAKSYINASCSFLFPRIWSAPSALRSSKLDKFKLQFFTPICCGACIVISNRVTVSYMAKFCILDLRTRWRM